MRVLLDTHAFLWWVLEDPRLSAGARSVIAAPDTDVVVSAVSAWEIAIKIAIGKLSLPKGADIAAELAHSGFLALPVEIEHAENVRSLPPLHRDPFDRLLVAQARVEGLTLVTVDRQLSAYGIAVVDATV